MCQKSSLNFNGCRFAYDSKGAYCALQLYICVICVLHLFILHTNGFGFLLFLLKPFNKCAEIISA